MARSRVAGYAAGALGPQIVAAQFAGPDCADQCRYLIAYLIGCYSLAPGMNSINEVGSAG